MAKQNIGRWLKGKLSLGASLTLGLLLYSCTPPQVPFNGAEARVPKLNIKTITEDSTSSEYDWSSINSRQRDPFPTLEDDSSSFWDGDQTWGNLFRSKRAQFGGDLLQVNNFNSIVSKLVPASTLDQETRAIQSQIVSLTAEVTNVLPNGVLAIYGEKVEFRAGESVRYVTTLQGYIRPSDITENNQLEAALIAKAQIKTTKAYKLSDIKDLRKQELEKILDEVNTINSINAANAQNNIPQGVPGTTQLPTTGQLPGTANQQQNFQSAP